jgi:hypothetical protein
MDVEHAVSNDASLIIRGSSYGARDVSSPAAFVHPAVWMHSREDARLRNDRASSWWTNSLGCSAISLSMQHNPTSRWLTCLQLMQRFPTRWGSRSMLPNDPPWTPSTRQDQQGCNFPDVMCR